MTVLATIALLAQVTASPCPALAVSDTVATLVVQAVDELWLPLPGAKVITWSDDTGPRWSATADKDGVARFAVPSGTYSVAVELTGFKSKTVKRVEVTAKLGESVPHVQVQLRVKAPKEILE